MNRLQGKTALITGGGTGFGLATAERFAAEGADVVIAGRRVEKGAEAVQYVREKTGREIGFFPCDVTREDEVSLLIGQALDRLKRLDILVCNAGVYIRTDFEKAQAEEWDRMVDTNMKAVFFCCKHVAPVMMRSRAGSIIVISSQVSLIGKSDVPIYAASKAGANMLTRSLALRYGPYNIRCNSICPGTIPTDLNRAWLTGGPDPEARVREIVSKYPLGRLGETIDVANAAIFLASEESKWITGVALAVDGGYAAGKE